MKATYVRVSSVEQNIPRQLEGKKGKVYWDKVSGLVVFENRKNAARFPISLSTNRPLGRETASSLI